MSILRLNDAIEVTPSSARAGMINLKWIDHKLMWMAQNNVTRLYDMSQATARPIWHKSGFHRPQEVWNELSVALLKHDIICEALVNSTMVIPLPEMDRS